MLLTAYYTVIVLIAAVAAAMSLRRDLTMFQQNSYRPDRFRRWINESGDSSSPMRLCGMAAFLFVLVPFAPKWLSMAMVGLFGVCVIISLARRKYKKPLVMTMRARRIYVTAIIMVALVAAVCEILFPPSSARFAALAEVFTAACCTPLVVVAANWLLKPVEARITRGYIEDARRRLASMPSLKIIGITGSYGKTSTKNYLARILSEQFETLMTPGSYNTTLGVVRTVREMLKPYHEVFIVEMGAKQSGDIKEICDLVHPRWGIITAVGPQHLESFKTIENVRDTKFELVDSLPSDGVAIVNDDFPMIADRPIGNCPSIRYAVRNVDGADYVAENIRYSSTGTSFTARCVADGHCIDIETRLVGECNISNLLAAVAMARTLGMDDEKIRFGAARIEQVEHRLSIKHAGRNLTIIDDAFNSNPVGSAMALDVLAAMSPARRVLITPGMIELGERQYELNAEFGEKAATRCDIAIVVGRYNREAIVEGLRKGGMADDCILEAESFAHAQQLLAPLTASPVAVLYENDLPDTFK